MLLAIDTSTRQLSLALASPERIIAESTWQSQNHHNTQLAPAIQHLLEQTDTQRSEIEAVAVAQGPGSYTGLRIGIALAKGFAHAQQVPLYAVPTLDIVAIATPLDTIPLIAVIPAGRGRILAARYEVKGEKWQQTAAPVLKTWAQVFEDLDDNVIINGEINQKGLEFLRQIAKPFRLLPLAWQLRRAAFLAQYAYTLSPQSPAMVQALYAKEP